jgi:hypothetical protein
MYLSHPVRRVRDDPVEGESVTLLVRAADEDGVEDLAERLADLGTVENRLRFATVKVTVPQPAVAAVCELPGIEAIETAKTLAMDAAGGGRGRRVRRAVARWRRIPRPIATRKRLLRARTTAGHGRLSTRGRMPQLPGAD